MSIWETPAVWAIKYQFHSDDPCSQYGVSGKCKMCKVVASPSQKCAARPNSGGRGSVRAAIASAGSAGASPSQKYAARPNSGGRGSVRAAIASAGSAGASPSQKYAQRDRTREGEDPSEPQSPRPAQRELRPPRRCATELGRARLCPGRNRLGRLSRSFALPEDGATRPNSGGRGSVRAAIASLLSRSFALPNPGSATELGRARLRPSRNRLGQRSSDRINPPITEEIGRIEVEGEDVEEDCWDTLRLSVLTPMALNGSTGDVDYSSAIP